jgi:anthranilate phosphoribosyltransferase
MSDDFWPRTLAAITSGSDLPAADAQEAMRRIMDGDATPGQIGGFLLALRTRGETADELEVFAETMLSFAVPVDAPHPPVDTCGTGGDRSGTFNISTIAAIVVAGAGVPVAKHGNRAASSHCGSADVLEALGVAIDLDAAGVRRCLEEAGIAFMFAPVFHPAMRHAGYVRRELGIATVFNFLGPLANPARPAAQVVGVSDARMLPLMAEVLARRGSRAMLFRGVDGLDELTTTNMSTVVEVESGEVIERLFDPTDFGLSLVDLDALKGGDAATSAEIARSILAGDGGPRRDVVCLNAAAALRVAGRADSLADGIEIAAAAIDDGSAVATLDRWIAVSQTAAGDSEESA